jgi:hypothetical protein
MKKNIWSNIKAWFMYEGIGYTVQVGTFRYFPWIPKWKEVNAFSEQEALEKVRSLGYTPTRVVRLHNSTFDPVLPIISLFFILLVMGGFLDIILTRQIQSDISITVALSIWAIFTIGFCCYIGILLALGYKDFKKTIQAKL